ncbi:MAG: PAS domain S-box-containing protein [Phenylobacterium sp.]|jgi:PAS domain S-box-containing protein
MRIKAKFHLNILLSVGLALLIGSTLFITSKQVEQAVQKDNVIDQIVKGIVELNLLAGEYLLHQEIRANRQWYIVYEDVSHLLHRHVLVDASQQKLLLEIQLEHKKLELKFAKITDIFDRSASNHALTALSQYSPMQQRLISHMLVNSQAMLGNAWQLSKLSKNALLKAQQQSSLTVVILVCILVVALITHSYFLSNSIIQPLSALKHSSQLIGDGDLSHKIGLIRADEIGELALAFDKMSATLSETTVSREYFDSIINSMANSLFVLNLDGTIRTINHSTVELTGYQQEQLIGVSIHLIFEKTPLWLQQADFSALIDQGSFANTEVACLSQPGTKIPMLISGAPMFDDKHQLMGIICVGQDITERKQLEKHRLYTNKMEALSKLTGGIAHDFNNMLGIVLGYCEILQKKLHEQPAQLKYVNNIAAAGKRGTELTSKLLSFSKHRPQNNQLVNINQLISTQLTLLQQSLTPTIELTMSLYENLWSLNIDTCSFDDMLLNIFLNAKDAMSSGGKMSIETKNVHLGEHQTENLDLPPGQYVMLSIQDNGCGMSAQVQEKIFDPFYTTKEHMGTGLGLSQVYGFVNACAGAITVESIAQPSTQSGTLLTFYFPRSRSAFSTTRLDGSNDLQNIKHIINGGDQRAMSVANKVVLVVDDEKQLCQLTQETLQANHFHIYTANNGEQALQILAHHAVDLVLSDVMMPKMNGYQLTDQVLLHYPNTKVLLSSGYQSSLVEQSRKYSPPLKVLNKPYTAKELISAVETCLAADTVINAAGAWGES